MFLFLQREPSKAGTTIGTLTIDHAPNPFGFTLEDEIREQAGKPVAMWKIAGQTAIPSGHYEILFSWSPRFSRPLPLLVNVEGFSGVRIHPLNTAGETDGCIGVGKAVNPDRTGILLSRVACAELNDRIRSAVARHERVWIQIRNPIPTSRPDGPMRPTPSL